MAKRKDLTGMTPEELERFEKFSRAGKLGGKARAAKQTPEERSELGKKAGAANKAAHSREHFVAMGEKGGRARLRYILANDPDFYSRNGKIGGQAMKDKHAKLRAEAEAKAQTHEDQQ